MRMEIVPKLLDILTHFCFFLCFPTVATREYFIQINWVIVIHFKTPLGLFLRWFFYSLTAILIKTDFSFLLRFCSLLRARDFFEFIFSWLWWIKSDVFDSTMVFDNFLFDHHKSLICQHGDFKLVEFRSWCIDKTQLERKLN